MEVYCCTLRESSDLLLSIMNFCTCCVKLHKTQIPGYELHKQKLTHNPKTLLICENQLETTLQINYLAVQKAKARTVARDCTKLTKRCLIAWLSSVASTTGSNALFQTHHKTPEIRTCGNLDSSKAIYHCPGSEIDLGKILHYTCK